MNRRIPVLRIPMISNDLMVLMGKVMQLMPMASP